MKSSCAALVAVLAACGHPRTEPAAPSPPPPPDAAPVSADPIDRFLVGLAHYRDQVCACRDAACVEAASTAWDREATRAPVPDHTPSTPAQDQRGHELQLAIEACRDRLAPTRGYQVVVVKVSGFADRMCACKDQACRDKVVADLETWSDTEGAAYDHVQPTAAQDHILAEAMGRMQVCAGRRP